jgi:hypothetical protein
VTNESVCCSLEKYDVMKQPYGIETQAFLNRPGKMYASGFFMLELGY